MKIAAQLYNCREYTKTPEGIEATLRRAKTIGFDVIQISGFGPCDPDLLATWVKEIGLEVCLTHTPWPRLADAEELKKVIAEHKKMGCPLIGLGSRPDSVFPNSYEGWTRFINKTKEITYFWDEHELKENKVTGNLQRFKGLGEMNADELWETTMNPDTRSLINVKITDALLAEKRVSVLMGDQVEPRKEWIEENVEFSLEDNYEI